VRLLAERTSAAALVLRDVSLIFLRREAQAERDLLHVLDTSVVVSFACFVVGIVATLFFLRAREQSLRNAQAARSAAEEANRAKSDFLATMSHEIRTPLNAVIGLSNLLGNTSLASQQRHFVETMEAAGGQLLQVVNDVLDFSRIQAGRVELVGGPVALRSFMDRLLLIVNGLPNAARLHVSGAISADVPPRVLADEARLMQILTNLMGNAVKFTRDGAVRLDIGVDAADAARPMLRFAVRDDGPGVPDELRAQIFEAFTQGRAERLRPHAGTGLGLSISRGLARLMGGDITLAPKAERGACFVLTLPLAVASTENVAHDGPVATEASGPLCVLVAEDTPTNQLVVRLMLEGLGHRVHLVGDGAQAVSRFGDDRFDLVILDIQMPVMDGYEAARRIRAAGAHGGQVPILALSAFTQASDRDLAAASGITGFLSKPVRQGDLAAAIARVASRAAPATGS
jgi:signal transduction histidine kinase/CheY-like chemotaxis protein